MTNPLTVLSFDFERGATVCRETHGSLGLRGARRGGWVGMRARQVQGQPMASTRLVPFASHPAAAADIAAEQRGSRGGGELQPPTPHTTRDCRWWWRWGGERLDASISFMSGCLVVDVEQTVRRRDAVLLAACAAKVGGVARHRESSPLLSSNLLSSPFLSSPLPSSLCTYRMVMARTDSFAAALSFFFCSPCTSPRA